MPGFFKQPKKAEPPKRLSASIYASVQRLSQEGDRYLEKDVYREAIECYSQALDLVPDPKEDWEASTWLFTSIGDALFQMGSYDKALDALLNAVRCPGGLGNVFIHLRLGQTRFELGQLDEAADDLMRAYMGAGEEIFEDDSPRYLEFLKTRAIP